MLSGSKAVCDARTTVGKLITGTKRTTDWQLIFRNSIDLRLLLSEGKKYIPKVFSALKAQVPQQAKRGLVYTKKIVFKGKRRKIRIHQSAFKVFVGDPFAQHWCWPPIF